MKQIRLRHSNGVNLNRIFSAKLLGGGEGSTTHLQWKLSATRSHQRCEPYPALSSYRRFAKPDDARNGAKRMRGMQMVLELGTFRLSNALTQNIDHSLTVLIYETE